MPKILVVDDDPLIRNLLEQILEPFGNRGVQLLSANDGMAAIESIRKERPDIVFLDLMMPRMNGFEVCNIVKKDLGMSDVCIIMLTAKGQTLDRQKAKGTGADFFITKPFNIAELMQKVSEILGIRLS